RRPQGTRCSATWRSPPRPAGRARCWPSGLKTRKIALWDVEGSTPELVTTREFGRQAFLATSPQGWIVVGDGTDIKFFTPEQFALGDPFEPTRILKGAMPKNDGTFARVSFTDDGRLMALAQFGPTGSRISLWDLEA